VETFDECRPCIQHDIQGTCGPPGTQVLKGGLYREWSDLVLETTALSKVREQLQVASAETDNVVLAGDVNLDKDRRLNVRYRRRCFMLTHDTGEAEAKMRYLEMGITYRSHNRHVREDGKERQYESILDHMCGSKDLVATINLLNDSTMDHFLLLASVMIDMLPRPTSPSSEGTLRRSRPLLSTERLKPGPGPTSTGTRTRTPSSRPSMWTTAAPARK
jgi:hypothetical protein